MRNLLGGRIVGQNSREQKVRNSSREQKGGTFVQIIGRKGIRPGKVLSREQKVGKFVQGTEERDLCLENMKDGHSSW